MVSRRMHVNLNAGMARWFKRATRRGPSLLAGAAAQIALLGCGARHDPPPEYESAATWNTEELANPDPLLPAHERKQQPKTDTPDGGSSPYEQLYTPVPEGGHEEGISPYESSGGGSGPSGPDGNELTP